MPLSYIVFHLVFSGCCAAALLVRSRPWTERSLTALLFALWLAGFLTERRSSWEWAAMRLPGSGWVFLVNLSLELVIVLIASLWRRATDRSARLRAFLLAPLLLVVAAASYTWYFRPLPVGLTGVPAADGTCLQTTEASCSAAAAVTLLAQHGIRKTEAEMAALCLTRAGLGTSGLGLYRGLCLASAPAALRPRLAYFDRPQELRHGSFPCIISVGLKRDCPPAIRDRMVAFGWEPGVGHSVVVLSAEAGGDWITVFDPTNGRERWPVSDLDYLWDGYALHLTAR